MTETADSQTHYTRRSFPTPNVVLSKCLEVAPCRHDGQVIRNSFVERLSQFVELMPVCPEVEIGLGTPRDSIRMVDDAGTTRLVQPSTDKDLTEKMRKFSKAYLEGLEAVDGFVLKSGSPTCGTANVKVYERAERSPPRRVEPGLFARRVQEQFEGTAIEDEGRLRNFYIRHHFLTRLYAYTELRKLGENPSMGDIVDFQRRQKHLLLLYDEPGLRELGRITANPDGLDVDEVYSRYAARFRKALQNEPNRRAHINVLSHIYGHFKDQISDTEAREFRELLGEIRDHQLTLNAPISVIRTWCARFEYQYMADQTYLEPYPRGLFEMRDSGKGFDF